MLRSRADQSRVVRTRGRHCGVSECIVSCMQDAGNGALMIVSDGMEPTVEMVGATVGPSNALVSMLFNPSSGTLTCPSLCCSVVVAAAVVVVVVVVCLFACLLFVVVVVVRVACAAAAAANTPSRHCYAVVMVVRPLWSRQSTRRRPTTAPSARTAAA